MGVSSVGMPRTSPRFRPACVRDTAAESVMSGVAAMPRDSSDPAHPVAPARQTEIVMIGIAPVLVLSLEGVRGLRRRFAAVLPAYRQHGLPEPAMNRVRL